MKHSRNTRRFGSAASFQRGVTLIELLVVMVIVGILAAIAYPSYQRYVARTHRNAAAACLSQIAQSLERRYTTNLTYVGADINPGCETENDLQRFYTITIPEASLRQSEYVVQAEPTAVQNRAEGQQCGTLSLNHTGTRRSNNNNTCW
ncbi:type IV pilin protein [Steroidobacter cummioxidans]|uniref:type IV pilin protein n=1 Tax=Steroidobacter cummioxidans TaxID=1803913 RepID=UPI000E315DCA|nr:type IV pilin protein [Steroidobacter cummioxidans]